MKPTLNLLTFASVFQRQLEAEIRASHAELFAALDNLFSVNMVLGYEMPAFFEKPNDNPTVVFVATGGTEGMVVEKYAQLPKPLVLVTDGKANSLAASLELCCWVRQHGDSCTLLHGQVNDVAQRLLDIVTAPAAETVMSRQRIGVVGEPSEWLVSSHVNYAAARKAWGVEFVDIPLTEVEENYKAVAHQMGEDETVAGEVMHAADKFMGKAKATVEPTRADVVKAVLLYKALKKVVEAHHLDALTLQCFSLIPTTGTTGCLALSMLNDEGIMAGCEGDVPSIFSMLLAKRVTGVDGFMANPAFIDSANGTIILAHCTIGLKQVNEYVVRSHFESQSGVAIQGILPEGNVTIVKFGGEDLTKRIVLTGKIVENQDDERKCRTQILIKFDDPEAAIRYFMTSNIGNHHVILQGNHAEALNNF